MLMEINPKLKKQDIVKYYVGSSLNLTKGLITGLQNFGGGDEPDTYEIVNIGETDIWQIPKEWIRFVYRPKKLVFKAIDKTGVRLADAWTRYQHVENQRVDVITLMVNKLLKSPELQGKDFDIRCEIEEEKWQLVR